MGGVWAKSESRNQGDRSLDYEFVIKGPVPLISQDLERGLRKGFEFFSGL